MTLVLSLAGVTIHQSDFEPCRFLVLLVFGSKIMKDLLWNLQNSFKSAELMSFTIHMLSKHLFAVLEKKLVRSRILLECLTFAKLFSTSPQFFSFFCTCTSRVTMFNPIDLELLNSVIHAGISENDLNTLFLLLLLYYCTLGILLEALFLLPFF